MSADQFSRRACNHQTFIDLLLIAASLPKWTGKRPPKMENALKTSKGILSLTIVLLAAIVFVGSVAADTASFEDIDFHPFTLDAGNGTCVLYDDPQIGSTRNCDPVNLVFPGLNVTQVAQGLIARGWSTSGAGSSQSLHYLDGQLYAQLMRSVADFN